MRFEDEENPPVEGGEEGETPTNEDSTNEESKGSDEASTLDNLNADDAVEQEERDLEAVYDIPVKVAAVLGHASMPVNQLLKLGRGAVVELDRRVGEAIDIYVNNLLVARGEVVIVDDKLGITMTEIIKSHH